MNGQILTAQDRKPAAPAVDLQPRVPVTEPLAADLKTTEAQKQADDHLGERTSQRDRLNADEAKSADTLSTTNRTIASGLALITYTFLTTKDHSDFASRHFHALRTASILGLISLILDGGQYVFSLLQITRTRNTIRKNRIRTVDGIADARVNIFFYIRNGLFFLKIVAAIIGAGIIITAVLKG